MRISLEFDNSFDVPLPPDETWALLRDIERIAPCMPGAKLTEILDEDTFKGEVAVRLGPVSLTFKGQAHFEDVDDAERKARVKAVGKDAKGRGGADAVVDFRVEPAAGRSTVLIHTDLMLSGPVAQYGRGVGMVQDLAAQLIGQFAERLKTDLAAITAAPEDAETAPKAEATPVKPVSGLSLMFKVLWNAIVRLFSGRSAAS
jgi:carbon monoxide dehydrogenase subunit G